MTNIRCLPFPEKIISYQYERAQGWAEQLYAQSCRLFTSFWSMCDTYYLGSPTGISVSFDAYDQPTLSYGTTRTSTTFLSTVTDRSDVLQVVLGMRNSKMFVSARATSHDSEVKDYYTARSYTRMSAEASTVPHVGPTRRSRLFYGALLH